MSIPSSPRRSRIAHFKAPFIISVAGSAALGLGCGGKTDADGDRFVTTNPPPQVSTVDGVLTCDGDPPDSTAESCGDPIWTCVDGKWKAINYSCNPPPPQSTVCPESPPEIGTSCWNYLGGLSCEYGVCPDILRRCNESSGLWESPPVASCNPPAVCGVSLPVPGSDCTVSEVSCSYPGGCEEPSTAVCISGQWFVTYSSGPACNPPAVVPVCPERDIVAGAGCAYEGQQCGDEACESDAAAHDGHVCTSGQWHAAVVTCAPGGSTPDAGASDAGVRDGGG